MKPPFQAVFCNQVWVQSRGTQAEQVLRPRLWNNGSVGAEAPRLARRSPIGARRATKGNKRATWLPVARLFIDIFKPLTQRGIINPLHTGSWADLGNNPDNAEGGRSAWRGTDLSRTAKPAALAHVSHLPSPLSTPDATILSVFIVLLG